jgi:hypothetical protein
MNTPKLPQTDSIQELAQFWDTHDLTDFEGQLEEVTEPVFDRDTTVQIHLESDEVDAVTKIAQSKGVANADLIRQWVVEKLDQEVRP